MKITNPEVIKNGEKDLIASVQEDLDPNTVREILKERLDVASLSSKGGKIVIHDNDIAFRLDFEVNLSGSLLFDRDGNLIEDQAEEPAETNLEPDLNLDDDEIDDDLDGTEDIDPDQEMSADPLENQDEDPIDDLAIDLPEYDLEEELDEKPETELETELEELIDETERGDDVADENNPPPQDLDDDIDDILKESREFWEKKEES